MKTTKFFSILSLAIFFLGINAAYPKTAIIDIPKGLQATSVNYDVYVHLSGDYNTCNVYLVQVMDEQGNLVAPVQRFEPGITKYNFHEQGLRMGRLRIAKLVRAVYPNHFVCVNDLYTPPAVKEGPFLLGHTYSFDLYPVWVISKEINKETSSQ
jgi:hypothetical protein